MLMFLCLVLFPLISLFIPLQYWNWLISPLRYIKLSLVRPFQSSPIKKAEKLILWVSDFKSHGLSGTESSLNSLPQYKWFSELLILLVGLQRSYGTPLRKSLGEVLINLRKDLFLEKICSKTNSSAYLQFTLISSIVWIFSFLAGGTLGLKRESQFDFLLGGMHLFGFCLYALAAGKLKRIHLSWSFEVTKSLLTFRALLNVGLASSEINQLSKIAQAIGQLKLKNEDLALQLEKLIQNWQNLGQPIQEDLSHIFEDYWLYLETCFKGHTKHLEVLKFTLLSVVFLGSYFFYLSHLFGRILVE